MSLILRGKVREVHDVGDGRLVMVTSDRISAYDVVMPTEIPGKGQVLTALSVHWFHRMRDIVPNHLLGWRLSDMPEPFRKQEYAGRVMLVQALDMLPVECVVRGYLIGSGWRDYQQTGATSGVALPAGLQQADVLPQPIFTPASKAEAGDHDENITMDDVVAAAGPELAAEMERVSLAVYRRAAEDCGRAGIILADTKFEMGTAQGTLTLGDEVCTPDSSRFWPADTWTPGTSPPSFDKQYLRDWLDESGWDHTPPGPELPPEVVAGTRERYVEAYERITGRSFDEWLKEAAE
ncbi:MAG: phosphoribosylaminoimidazolesuccinocarboxamide synthase [Thermoleophilia bacterium]|nr:phosphoribosylaminoimidazolesuccinocarboxamide synthase [Thermoleophilia bacterium]